MTAKAHTHEGIRQSVRPREAFSSCLEWKTELLSFMMTSFIKTGLNIACVLLKSKHFVISSVFPVRSTLCAVRYLCEQNHSLLH